MFPIARNGPVQSRERGRAAHSPGIMPFKPPVALTGAAEGRDHQLPAGSAPTLTPEVTLEAGRQALAIATQIVEAIAAHSERAHLSELSGATIVQGVNQPRMPRSSHGTVESV